MRSNLTCLSPGRSYRDIARALLPELQGLLKPCVLGRGNDQEHEQLSGPIQGASGASFLSSSHRRLHVAISGSGHLSTSENRGGKWPGC